MQKLTRFKNSVKQKLVKFWHDKMELYGQVPIALHNQIENTARPGWIRTDTTLSRGRGSYRLRDLLERSDVSIGLSEAIIHQDDQEWEAWARGLLSSIPTESGQKSAYFLEHSGSRAQTMIADTLKHGWNVKLLIKNFETEKNRFQRNRIKASMAFFNTAMPEQIQTGRLQIVRTDVAPGLKARYFEDTLLTLSWYLKTAPSPQDSDLWGHENLHVSFVPSSRDWPTALKFWKEKLFVRFTDIARSVS